MPNPRRRDGHLDGHAIVKRMEEMRSAYDGGKRGRYLLERLREHMERFPHLQERDDTYIEQHFLAAMSPPDCQLSCTLTDAATIRTFGLRWSSIEQAEARIEYTCFMKGAQRLARMQPPRREKRYPSAAALMIWARELFPRATARERELLAFWTVLVQTGGRPNNLAQAPLVRFSSSEVAVRWLTRKGGRVQLRGDTSYPSRWTCIVPEEIRLWIEKRHSRYLAEGGCRRNEPFWNLKATSVASCVWNLLRTHPQVGSIDTTGWTSTTPRDVAARRFYFFYESKEFDHLKYEWLMDHTLESGRGHYLGSQ